MTEIETKQLVLRTNCFVVDGDFTIPERKVESILNIRPSKSEDGGFAIYLKEGNIFIGHIGLCFDRKPYELCVSIDEPYQGNGYMTEAQSEVIRWIFDNCSTDTISALIGPISPVQSHRLCKRVGFQEAKENNEDWWILKREGFVPVDLI